MTPTMKSKRSTKTPSRNFIPHQSHDSCLDPLVNLAEFAAVKARDAAEAYFTLQNLNMAIMQAMAAKQLDPDLLGVDNFITAYKIHKAVFDKKTWYQVLGMRKQYKRMALALHPDKNGAFKLVKATRKRAADDDQRCYKRSFTIIRKSNPGQKTSTIEIVSLRFRPCAA